MKKAKIARTFIRFHTLHTNPNKVTFYFEKMRSTPVFKHLHTVFAKTRTFVSPPPKYTPTLITIPDSIFDPPLAEIPPHGENAKILKKMSKIIKKYQKVTKNFANLSKIFTKMSKILKKYQKKLHFTITTQTPKIE